MTAKEALNSIKEIFIHNEYGESRGSTYDLGISLCETIEKSLTELEELKRDVARYFELRHSPEGVDVFENEFIKLYNKLSKVGQEDATY